MVSLSEPALALLTVSLLLPSSAVGLFCLPSVLSGLGDPIRALQLQVITDVIRRDHLLANVNAAGAVLMDGLQRLAKLYPALRNPRGQGQSTAARTHDCCFVTQPD